MPLNNQINIIICFLIALIASIIVKADEPRVMSCGSVIKLKHKETGHHLHSHEIAWGSGSGQQSVTGHGSANGKNRILC
jgi:dolichyl-phosphate-mannose--protein O-mannosyl transferase